MTPVFPDHSVNPEFKVQREMEEDLAVQDRKEILEGQVGEGCLEHKESLDQRVPTVLQECLELKEKLVLVELTGGLEDLDPEDHWDSKDLMEDLELRVNPDSPERLEWMVKTASQACPT